MIVDFDFDRRAELADIMMGKCNEQIFYTTTKIGIIVDTGRVTILVGYMDTIPSIQKNLKDGLEI